MPLIAHTLTPCVSTFNAFIARLYDVFLACNYLISQLTMCKGKMIDSKKPTSGLSG